MRSEYNRRTTGRFASFVIGFVLFSGCASLPKNFDAVPSRAEPPDFNGAIGKILKPEYDKHPRQSAFILLDKAENAFLARIALAEAAEKTIDAQYFIWNGDKSGVILMYQLVQAADRGVRVRLLIDDLTTHGHDLGLAALNQHKNIQIRLFNPLGRRYYFGIFRTIAMAFHAARMTNRMHNKVFAVDNQFAIVGGRNIGDEYFGLDKRLNFRDMDVMAAGPVVPEVSAQFDKYWNSRWAVPLDVFGIKVPTEKTLMKKTGKLKKRFDKMARTFPYGLDFTKKGVLDRLESIKSEFVWADSEVICDPPDKAWEPVLAGESSSAVVVRLTELAESAHEATIVSPYLLLSEQEIEQFHQRIKGGMKVSILTNSMTSTDAIPVVAHYMGTRKSLLEAGIQLYEARPDAVVRTRHRAPANSSAIHGLHAKITVLDKKDVFIGTFNIDPRSMHLNTETGILIHSQKLGAQLLETLQVDLLPVNSWKLQLSPKSKLEWVGEDGGKEVRYHSDPKAGFWRRLAAGFLAILPIKGQL